MRNFPTIPWGALSSYRVIKKFQISSRRGITYGAACAIKKNLWSLFMDRVQLHQGYRATTRRQFTFNHLVPRISWYSFDQPWKDKRLYQD